MREGELRVSANCIAAMGQPSHMQYGWTSRDSAQYVAEQIKGKVVEL